MNEKSWISQVHDELRVASRVQGELSHLASAFRFVGNVKVAEQLAEMANELYDMEQRITDICHGKIDDDVQDAEKNSKAMLQMALMTVKEK